MHVRFSVAIQTQTWMDALRLSDTSRFCVHPPIIKRRESSSLQLLILAQLLDRNAGVHTPIMNKGHDIQRPVGRSKMFKKLKIHCVLNRALEAFQFQLAAEDKSHRVVLFGFSE